MNYRLIQKSVNKSVAKFHVQNERGDIIGSINVPPNEADSLMRHWNGHAQQRVSRRRNE
jgi:hypothetical protein